MATILEDFEDDTFSLLIGGDWARDDDYAAFGTYSLKSADIAAFGVTEATVTVPAGATSLTFYYRVSSEEDYDQFYVLVDGAERLVASGEVAWTPATLAVTGASVVTFRYDKDQDVDNGSDAAWVDQIEFTIPGELKSATDNGALTETANATQAPEVAKIANDSGRLTEARWRNEPQGGTVSPSIRSSSTAVSGLATYTINAPAGVVLNDVLIAIQAGDRASTATMTTPIGGTTWEPLDALDATSPSNVIQAVRVWWKRAGSAEPGLYTFKHTGGSEGLCVIVAVKGASLTVAPKLLRSTDGTGLSVTTPGITPTSDGDLELRLVAAYAFGTAMTFAAPAGLTPVNAAQSRVYTVLAAAARQLRSNAATAPANFVASVDEVIWRSGYTLAIAPAVAGPPEVTKSAADAAAVAESSTVVVVPDGEPHAANDAGTLTETATVTADATSLDVATLHEAVALDAGSGTADSGTLAEALMLQLGWSSVDQAQLTDGGQVGAQAASADTGTLVELVDVAKTIGPVSSDAGTLAEATLVDAVAAAADAGTLTEATMLELGQGSADQALLAENAQVEAQPASVDGGALAETVDVAKMIGPVTNDLAALTEVATVEAQVAAADAGALTESAVAAVVKESTDFGQLFEFVSAGLDVVDTATLIESAVVDAVIAASESASLADTSSLEAPKFATDAAVLVEHAEVLDIGRAVVGAGLVRRGWSAHSPRRRWAVGKPRRAWRADSPHT
ncbi:hypothetical protein AB0I81_29955 [Nonomuraea sp. NPDC050404]|uniref:hypothetical protein n=1 Tax=Nonomuraea sp. NPDC050404 TaxID=3155783 RepID=UPI0033FCA366